MLPELTVWRIEDERGKGPFKWVREDSFISKDCLDKLWNIEPPALDFEILKSDPTHFLDYYIKFEKVCQDFLKHENHQCFFGFPSYEVFKKWVGEYEDQISEYVTTYRTRHYIISDSGNQVLFAKGA
jgi:hypothetical protein